MTATAAAAKKKAGRVSSDVPAPSAEAVASGSSVLSLGVPFVPTEKYAQREVYMSLRADHAETLRGVLEGLELRGAKLAGGRPVQNAQDAIRWVLEEVARLAG